MNKSVIEDYFAGKCNPDQAREVKDFLESEEGRIYLTENLIYHYWEEALNVNKVEKRIQQEYKNERKFFLLKVAALFILLITTGAGLYLLINSGRNVQPTMAVQAKIKIMEVPAGKKTSFRLPDGSFVWLNSDSKILFNEKFDGVERIVELKGEAYFSVKKDPKRPFKVKSGNIVITALGTQFSVNYFPGDLLTKVSLAEGKVKIENFESLKKTENLILNPGQGIKYNKNSLKLQKVQFNAEEEYGWMKGLLIFNKAKLDEVVKRLERWYGVKIIVNGDLSREWSFTGRFNNEPLEQVLRVLSLTRNFSYKKEQKLIVLTFKNYNYEEK